MKRLFIALLSLAALTFTACNTNNPDGPIPDSFPKKHLIEEFTGQGCGYCPYGMNCISDFTANDTNFIVILHHYGYKQDHFTVSGRKTITNTLGVNGAPSMTIDRAKTKTEKGSQTVFHPGYLPTTDKAQFTTTTYASVEIENNYDAVNRQLNIKVSGALATQDHPALFLTVLVKESGMVDYQSDYYYSFEGWEEFRHTNAVRAFLTDAKGDEVSVKKNRYSTEYTLVLDENWVAENCMVVAFLSEEFKPVVQAAEKPAVAGTKGGADIEHGGIKAVPVSDFYPEPSATAAPKDYSGVDADSISYALVYSELVGNLKEWVIMAYEENANVKVGGTRCVPFTYIYLYTEASATEIATGTYELNNSRTAGAALAGYRDDAQQQIDGSIFYYTSRNYLKQGSLDPRATWLITDGTVTLTEEGWEVVGHARNGSDIHIVGTTPVEYYQGNAPAKLKRL